MQQRLSTGRYAVYAKKSEVTIFKCTSPAGQCPALQKQQSAGLPAGGGRPLSKKVQAFALGRRRAVGYCFAVGSEKYWIKVPPKRWGGVDDDFVSTISR